MDDRNRRPTGTVYGWVLARRQTQGLSKAFLLARLTPASGQRVLGRCKFETAAARGLDAAKAPRHEGPRQASAGKRLADSSTGVMGASFFRSKRCRGLLRRQGLAAIRGWGARDRLRAGDGFATIEGYVVSFVTPFFEEGVNRVVSRSPIAQSVERRTVNP